MARNSSSSSVENSLVQILQNVIIDGASTAGALDTLADSLQRLAEKIPTTADLQNITKELREIHTKLDVSNANNKTALDMLTAMINEERNSQKSNTEHAHTMESLKLQSDLEIQKMNASKKWALITLIAGSVLGAGGLITILLQYAFGS